MAQAHYFLGSNSRHGFYSLYSELIDPATASSCHIIKGGPGSGKSSLMRRVADRAEQAGFPVEYIRCSGDPDSLDGIRLPAQNAAIVDGTSPHVRRASRNKSMGGGRLLRNRRPPCFSLIFVSIRRSEEENVKKVHL